MFKEAFKKVFGTKEKKPNITKPKETTIDEDIEQLQQRQRIIKKKVDSIRK